jgi:hypothetical protein
LDVVADRVHEDGDGRGLVREEVDVVQEPVDLRGPDRLGEEVGEDPSAVVRRVGVAVVVLRELPERAAALDGMHL